MHKSKLDGLLLNARPSNRARIRLLIAPPAPEVKTRPGGLVALGGETARAFAKPSAGDAPSVGETVRSAAAWISRKRFVSC